MLDKIRNRSMKKKASVLVAFGMVMALCKVTHSNIFVLNTLCLWGLAGIYLSFFCYFVVCGYGKRRKIGIRLLGAGITMVVMLIFPIKYGDVLTANYQERQMLENNIIEIVPLEDVNASATAAEIWVDKIEVDYVEYDVNNVILSDGWMILDGHIYAPDARNAQILKIELPLNSRYNISCIQTEASGMIEFRVGGAVSKRVDLYRGERLSVPIDCQSIWGRVTTASAGERYLYYIIYYIILYWIIGAGVQALFKWYEERKNIINSRSSEKI